MVSRKLRIFRLVEEVRTRDVFASLGRVGLLRALAAGLERQFELHAGRVIDEQLPQRRAGNDEFAKIQTGLLEARYIRAIARTGQRDVIDRGGARFRLSAWPERRAAGIDVDDGEPARLGAAEPRAGIAEIRPRKFAQADDVDPELARRRQIVGFDRDVK